MSLKKMRLRNSGLNYIKFHRHMCYEITAKHENFSKTGYCDRMCGESRLPCEGVRFADEIRFRLYLIISKHFDAAYILDTQWHMCTRTVAF